MDGAELRRLLLALVGWREDDVESQSAAEEAIAAYRREPDRHVLGFGERQSLLGMIGLQLAGGATAVIRHMVVDPSVCRRSIGRSMIAGAFLRFDLSTITAEAGREALGFYAHCGFDVTLLAEKYPGVERFRCMWMRPR